MKHIALWVEEKIGTGLFVVLGQRPCKAVKEYSFEYADSNSAWMAAMKIAKHYAAKKPRLQAVFTPLPEWVNPINPVRCPRIAWCVKRV